MSSFEDIRLFISIFFLATLAPMMLRLFSFPRLIKILTPHKVQSDREFNLERLKNREVRFTDYILNRNFWIYKHSCLKRSLILYHILRKSGIDVHICFGVKYGEKMPEKEKNNELEAHAWLLHEGSIFLERNEEITKTYKIIYRFP